MAMKTLDIEPNSADAAEGESARVARKQAAVRELIHKNGRDGRSVFGRLPDDDLTREAWALGEAWRKSEAP